MTGINRHKRNTGFLRSPEPTELQEFAARDFLELSDTEARELVTHVEGFLSALNELDELRPFAPELKYPLRDPGRAPIPEEDPLNAFIRLCHVEGAASGLLAGKRVAVKDNLSVAGVPTTNGSRTMAFVPTIDAVVVERILDAGGAIVGKLNLDEFSFGSPVGYGTTSHFGPPRNPRRPSHSAGGSSGGSGSAVVSGAVDVALGGDEGGSARLPAAYCGCVAIKATHGLVPSFGLTYFDHTLDSICPMARSVVEAARLLEAVAGHDWRDPQWVRGQIPTDDYMVSAESGGVDDLRVGVVTETLDPARCEKAILDGVSRAAAALQDSGAIVKQVSVPMWDAAWPIWVGVLLAGTPAMVRSDGVSSSHLGFVDEEKAHAQGLVRRSEGKLLSPLVRLTLLTNSFVEKHYFGTLFAKALNQRIAFTRLLDETFTEFDVLLTPTTPTVAKELPTRRLEEHDFMAPVLNQAPFTAPLNVSGHPAIAVPSGVDAEGLPTSVQIISRHFDEVSALRAARCVEQSVPEDFTSAVSFERIDDTKREKELA